MCGIVGIHGSQDDSWIEKMNRAQAHRGPDDQGVHRDREKDLALAMRRLSIIDLSEGHQPMVDERRGRVIVFNGEIFNAPELRESLVENGYMFFTNNSDTEVLLYLYDFYGTDMLERLNGMFGFVIYDQEKGTLFGARDRIGIKPLYYIKTSDRFAFASELKSLLTLPFVGRDLDCQSVHHFLSFQFIPAPRSIFSGVLKIPPGHCFHYNLSDKILNVERYWHPPCGDSERNIDLTNEDEAVEMLRVHLRKAVRAWLISDVSVGCSLSGGNDSGAVVGLMAELGISPIRTWTLGFEEAHVKGIDERDLARKVAEKWDTEHHEISIRADDILEDLHKMVWHLDEPYAGGLPSWYVFREMSKSVKVAMTGSGGDELFGNYGKWLVFQRSKNRVRRIAKRFLRNGIGEFMRYPHGSLYHGYFCERDKRGIWAEPLDLLETSPALLERMWKDAGTDDPRQVVPFIDFQLQLPEEFLHMTDRFSMAFGLEARVPFLDHKLVEFALRFSPDLRTSKHELKRLMRRAITDLLPRELLEARKYTFVLPQSAWLRGKLRPMVEEFLGPEFLKKQGLFNTKIYGKYVLPHIKEVRDFGWQVWTLLMFQIWWNQL